MKCIACGATAVSERPDRTAQGYRRFREKGGPRSGSLSLRGALPPTRPRQSRAKGEVARVCLAGCTRGRLREFLREALKLFGMRRVDSSITAYAMRSSREICAGDGEVLGYGSCLSLGRGARFRCFRFVLRADPEGAPSASCYLFAVVLSIYPPIAAPNKAPPTKIRKMGPRISVYLRPDMAGLSTLSATGKAPGKGTPLITLVPVSDQLPSG
jgi:hypothetical protein